MHVDYTTYPAFNSPKVETSNLPLMRKVPKLEPTSPWKGTQLSQDPYQLFGPTSSRLASTGKKLGYLMVVPAVIYFILQFCSYYLNIHHIQLISRIFKLILHLTNTCREYFQLLAKKFRF